MAEIKYKLEDEPANFRGKKGRPFLVRCPRCGLENHSMAVAAGQCAWCRWSEDEKTERR